MKSTVRLSHREDPRDYSAHLAGPDGVWRAAVEYLHDVAKAYGWSKAQLAGLDRTGWAYDPQAGEGLRRGAAWGTEAAVVTLDRTMFGLPVWREGVAVHLRQRSGVLEVLASSRAPAGRLRVKAAPPKGAKIALESALELVEQALGPAWRTLTSGDEVKLEATQLCVARALPDLGGDPSVFPWNQLRKAEGRGYHLALEVVMSGPRGWHGGMVRVVLALDTLGVLALEMGGSGATVDVSTWKWDPFSRGTAALGTVLSAAQLNSNRETFGVTTLAAGVIDTARACFFELDVPSNGVAPAGSPMTPNVNTTTGGILAGVVQVDEALSRIEDVGFTLSTYLPGQVAVGGSLMLVDGAYLGGAGIGYTGTGINAATILLFGNRADGTWGALDRRIVYHEVFGHVVLLNRIGTTNLPFAHSFGDAVAAVRADVDNPDRAAYQTFPYSAPAPLGTEFPGNPLARRHDRAPSPGVHWGWGAGIVGTDNYTEEQKLSSTIFRLYRSLGGSSSLAANRLLAARLTTWLLLEAAWRMAPGSVPQTPEAFAEAMMDADSDDWTAMGWSGGAYHKVIRWAFEKQGSYTSPVATDAVGKPPAVDVFVVNPRLGEYTYGSSAATTTGIWNRLAADGLTAHQTPVAGVANYLYVRVGNRGTTLASGAKVQMYVANLGAGAVFPTDFSAVGKVVGAVVSGLTLTAPDVAAGDTVGKVVGPFAWIPTGNTFQTLLATVDHPSDKVNTGKFSALAPIQATRLVPHDNNCGVRWLVNWKILMSLNLAKLLLRFRLPAGATSIELRHEALDANQKVIAQTTQTCPGSCKNITEVTLSAATVPNLPYATAADVRTVALAGGLILGDLRWRG